MKHKFDFNQHVIFISNNMGYPEIEYGRIEKISLHGKLFYYDIANIHCEEYFIPEERIFSLDEDDSVILDKINKVREYMIRTHEEHIERIRNPYTDDKITLKHAKEFSKNLEQEDQTWSDL